MTSHRRDLLICHQSLFQMIVFPLLDIWVLCSWWPIFWHYHLHSAFLNLFYSIHRFILNLFSVPLAFFLQNGNYFPLRHLQAKCYLWKFVNCLLQESSVSDYFSFIFSSLFLSIQYQKKQSIPACGLQPRLNPCETVTFLKGISYELLMIAYTFPFNPYT